MSTVDALKKIGERLQCETPHHIPSPPTQPRRACVALILRWHTKAIHHAVIERPKTIQEFFRLPWVKDDGQPELLFMQRATRTGDRWSGHVAYIGGKNEPGETDLDTVTREVYEEIGLDLASDAFIELGRLDDREITSTYNRQLLMILVPFVFLQVVPHTPAINLQKDEVASVECRVNKEKTGLI
ncbi:NUDIX hydrolase domain-like protein [Chlamydoabsidia padenii]|nr:NUDIX hydrolase domain-like protein [Chlamydoabsidia padenii]